MKQQLGRARLLGSALAVGAALFAGSAQALPTYQNSTPFQGITFTFVQIDNNTITFEIKGTLGGDWATANYLGAFDLKDLGIDFHTATAIANGPGATNLGGLNDQLSASNLDCNSTASPPGGICFDIVPDFQLPGGTAPHTIDLKYTIDFSANLNIATTGPHLQIAFTETQNGPKVGSLYSQNVGLCTNCGGTPPQEAAEPGSLALLGLGLGFAGYVVRRRRKV